MGNAANWKIVEGDLLSKWAGDVDPGNPRPEYPRPQMTRESWQNLNGLWDYAIVGNEQEDVEIFEGKILVPFPVESALSGVKRSLLPKDRLWYRRSFKLDKKWEKERILIHFGGVDFETTLWINNQLIGEHRGGNLPFSFEITEWINWDGENEIKLAVWDPSDKGTQERGKQVLKPGGIWYTPASGIWQTVWIEPVPKSNICRVKISPDIDSKSVSVQIFLQGETDKGYTFKVTAKLNGEEIAKGKARIHETIRLNIEEPALWSPDSPTLYDLEVVLIKGLYKIDAVDSYFGMRKFHVAIAEDGFARIFLNNQPLFHYGPLDQGYWPDGLYTAPTEEAMLHDIEYAKKIGCNMIRKHIKVEPARWYYHCDRVGMIVWQDMPNGGKAIGGISSLLAMYFKNKVDDRKRLKKAGRDDPENRRHFMNKLQKMIDWLHNFPSIGMWVPFNEAWGQFNAAEVAKWLKEYDPSRPIDHASGWYDQGAGDFQSHHIYFSKLKMPKKQDERAFILSEFGGYSLKLPEHCWVLNKKFGYRFYKTKEELSEAYVSLLENQLLPLIPAGLAGAVYTQTTDVEMEINGYLTYDRKVEKMRKDFLNEVHQKLYE